MRDGRSYHVAPCIESGTRHTREHLKQQIRAGFDALSNRSRWLRFAGPHHQLSEQQLDALTRIDGYDCVAWCAAVGEGEGERGIGLARYIRFESDTTRAEFAITVIDAFQGQGIGRELMLQLLDSARCNGITLLYSSVLNGNVRMLALGKLLGGRVRASEGDSSLLEIPVLPA